MSKNILLTVYREFVANKILKAESLIPLYDTAGKDV
jgi:hypothetical protein